MEQKEEQEEEEEMTSSLFSIGSFLPSNTMAIALLLSPSLSMLVDGLMEVGFK
jgi:hypothetical protein